MNREQARKTWQLIKAYGEGKDLQYRKIGETEWFDERKHLGFRFDTDDYEFRIKPEEYHTCGECTMFESCLVPQGCSNTEACLNIKLKPEENYIIEQNCGENRVEGVVLSVNGSVSNELNKYCKWCKGKSCNCATCHNKDEENSYYLLHKDKFPEPKEKQYKPFEDSAELMVHYSKHFNIDFPPFYEPIIWVKRKDNDSRFLITGYDELDVFLEDCWQDLNDLYEQYVFLDGSPVGKLEE